MNVQGKSTDQRFAVVLLKSLINRDNKYQLNFMDDGTGIQLSEAKLHNDLLNDKIHIIWTLTSKSHEEKFQAIYIPIYRGMYGMRIPIVTKQNQNIFHGVKTLDDLKKFKAGQGSFWADTKILQANNLPVVKELKYINLFHMLEGDRFDYFPRGIPEPWAEIEREQALDLVVESNIMIRYTAPFYFFVNKSNKKLASYLTASLNSLISSGEYNKMFYSHPDIKSALNKANLKQRNVIHLKNPELTSATPTDRAELWFDPNQSLVH
ncbi:hypothetical protein XM47_15765 [Catenovulum maritimum]|uniref:Solute-binding protein family 3/N-terminal domain-containing protein n=1 Tax=Catenovulum maritimum TaxID=1513271 RepID=A0A0J8GMX7_9ALTE|nr:hypothetical protein XM47_15765 [Catenovulum maritimum]